MKREIYEDLFKNVVICGHYPLEKLNEMKSYIETLNIKIQSLEEENKSLKKQVESKYEKVGTLTGELLYEENTKLINQQKEFISYLENEKDRLARECSNIYENSLGKTRLVNEDIFNEVDTILSKYKEIIGGKE